MDRPSRASGTATPAARTGSRLFLVVFGLVALQAVFLIAGRRAPAGAAAFDSGDLFQTSLPLSISGMLLQELLLLAGAWRLASRQFPSPWTRYFVTVAAAASAQGAHSVAALPLILSLLHDALETPARTALVLAGSLLFLQTLGGPSTTAPALIAGILLYWAAAVLLYQYPLRERLKNLPRRDALGAAGLLGLVVATALVTGRPAAESPSPLGGLLDVALGVSTSSQAAGYCGMLTLAFAALGLALQGAGRTAVFAGSLLLALLPPPGLSLLRFVLIALSGVGFQGLLDGRFRGSGAPRFTALGLALLAVGLGALSELAIVDPAAMSPVALRLSMAATPSVAVLDVQRAGLASDLPGISALMAGLGSLLLFLWSTGRRGAPLALSLALVLHPLDVFGWKFRMTWLSTVPLHPGQLLARMPGLPKAWAIPGLLLALLWMAWLAREFLRLARSGRA